MRVTSFVSQTHAVPARAGTSRQRNRNGKNSCRRNGNRKSRNNRNRSSNRKVQCMAIVGVSFKSSTSAPPSAKHVAYIAREGEYAKRGDLEYLDHGNMPEFATQDSRAFWQAADAYERANGRAYTELQLTLPRELTPAGQQDLAREAVREFMGERFAYTIAIHCPLASDKLDQPHIHLMFSERIVDDRTRELGPDEFFRRNGAKKDRDWNLKTKPAEIRTKWCDMMNRAFEAQGHEVRVDPRSYIDQGREDLHQLREDKCVRGRETEIEELRKLRAEIDPNDHSPGAGKEIEDAIAHLETAAVRYTMMLDLELAALQVEQAKLACIPPVDPSEARLAELDKWFPELKTQHVSGIEWWVKSKVWSLEDLIKREPRTARQIFLDDAENPTRKRLLSSQIRLKEVSKELRTVQEKIDQKGGSLLKNVVRRVSSLLPMTETSKLYDRKSELEKQKTVLQDTVKSAEKRYGTLLPGYELRAQHEGKELAQEAVLANRQRDSLILAAPEIQSRAIRQGDETRQKMHRDWPGTRGSGPEFER